MINHWKVIILLFLATVSLNGCIPASEVGAEFHLPENMPTATPLPHTPTITATATIPPTATFTPAAATVAPSKQVSVMAVGDINLGRTIGEMILNEGIHAPFEYTAHILSSADVTIGNLECAITERGDAEVKSYTFRAPLPAAESLAQAGFDLLSLANNHILDFGVAGLEDTLFHLSQNQLEAVGAGMNDVDAHRAVYREINGLVLAFLAYADIPPGLYDYTQWQAGTDQPGIAWADLDRIIEEVAQADAKADAVIVMLHFGYEDMPNYVGDQRDLAYALVDAGADLIVGSHPHVLYPIVEYNGAVIAYSLGNFVFDQSRDGRNTSAILEVEFDETGIAAYRTYPILILANGVPQEDYRYNTGLGD